MNKIAHLITLIFQSVLLNDITIALFLVFWSK